MELRWCDSCSSYTECEEYERPAGSLKKVDVLWFCDFCASSHAATSAWCPGYLNGELLADMARMMNVLWRKINERL